MAKKKAKKVDVMGVLGASAKKAGPKKKKDENPTVDLPNTDANKQALEAWLKHKREERSASAKRKKEQEKLMGPAIAARTEWCLANKFTKAVKIKVGDTEPIGIAFQAKYGAISTDDTERLQEIFGDDYDRCFETITEVSLKEDAMKEVAAAAAEDREGPLDKIIAAIGPAKFAEIFEVKQSVKPTDALDQGRVTDKALNQMASRAIEEELLKPQNPLFQG